MRKKKMVATRSVNGATSERQRLLKALDQLPMPDVKAFRSLSAPPSSELSSYRLIEDSKLRLQFAEAHLIEVVQRPGPGNWKKTKPPAYIARVYPNFDAPSAKEAPARAQRSSPATESATALRLPAAIAHDLRANWESYYVDTRPENQRRHAQRAQSVEPNSISARANHLIAEARSKGRHLGVRDAMFAATEELTADFETAMRRKYGDLLVDILGVPNATDTRARG